MSAENNIQIWLFVILCYHCESVESRVSHQPALKHLQPDLAMHVPALMAPSLNMRETITLAATKLSQIAVSADVFGLLISLSRLNLQYGALNNPSEMRLSHASS